MDFSVVIQEVLVVVFGVGLPLVVLLWLAVQMGVWYDAHEDPPFSELEGEQE